MQKLIILLIIILSFSSIYCHNDSSKKQKTSKDTIKTKDTKGLLTIEVIPFEGMPSNIINSTFERIKLICPNVVLLKTIKFPINSYYKPRNRYKADSIICYLSSITPKNHVTIGLTNKDISTTKDNIQDWGVMGLGFMPGNACVASTFRLDKNNLAEQYFKVAIHELGHTQGLDHCNDEYCFMRDAEGKNHTNQETGFCKKCKDVLLKKGWKF